VIGHATLPQQFVYFMRYMNSMKTLFAAWLVVFAVFTAAADEVDRYVEARLKRDNLPGASIAVVRNGKVVKARGYGLADVENNVPATEHTVYQWASITKQFTAGAIMLLARDGKIDLAAPVSRYYTNAPVAWSNITVRHLIYHTSGIKSYTSLRDFFKTIRKDYAPEELIDLVRNLPLEFDPGEKWSYNNTAYYLLGLIVERVSGKSYNEFLAECIFKPAGMETARLNDQFEIIPHRATGYTGTSNRIIRAEFVSPSQPYSAGALVGTVLDLAKWDSALYTDQIFAAAARDEMWKPVVLNQGNEHPYAFGWFVEPLRGHKCVAHSGGIHGFSTHIARFVDDKLTVIVLMNSMRADAQSVAKGIAGYYLPGVTLASVKPPKKDPDPDLSARLKQALFDLADGKSSEIITAEFREDYARSTNRVAALKQRLKDLKAFTFVTFDKPSKTRFDRFGVPIARLLSYKLVTPAETRFYTFELTPDNRVAWYQSSAD
jgi:D-alanyl-D-alanine carboxypeptidase